jgi:phosphohistidine swiveling domain-containing protein
MCDTAAALKVNSSSIRTRAPVCTVNFGVAVIIGVTELDIHTMLNMHRVTCDHTQHALE